MKLINKIALVSTLTVSLSAFAKPTIELYKSPSCGCCNEWVEIMQKKGYKVNTHHDGNWMAVKKKFRMPSELTSCHTAVIDGYLVEGHVPEADIARLLKERPTNISGIAAPGMPQHAPGMARAGESYKNFSVVAFDQNGKTSLYQQY